jgi:hypothetical protein
MTGLCDATRGYMRESVRSIQSVWTGALEDPRVVSHAMQGPDHPVQMWGRR